MSKPVAPELDAQFADYEARVIEYGIRWWISNPAVESAIRRRPELLPKLEALAACSVPIETADVYLEAGTWNREREQMQESLLRKIFEGKVTRVASPSAIFLLGLPGSGKSTVLRAIALRYLERLNDRSAVVRDADDIRERLPEYESGLGSLVVEDEVVHVTYVMSHRFIPTECSLLIDTVGDPNWLSAEVRDLAAPASTSLFCVQTYRWVSQSTAPSLEQSPRAGTFLSNIFAPAPVGHSKHFNASWQTALRSPIGR